jgi:hypothetical protein
MEGLKPFFTSSDTGSAVYLLDGEPQFLSYDLGDHTVKVSLPDMLEMYKLFNGIWYSGTWRYLNICTSGFCTSGTPAGHIRMETCPKMTEYEKKVYDEYLGNMRKLHMEENRPPIANGVPSNNAQQD